MSQAATAFSQVASRVYVFHYAPLKNFQSCFFPFFLLHTVHNQCLQIAAKNAVSIIKLTAYYRGVSLFRVLSTLHIERGRLAQSTVSSPCSGCWTCWSLLMLMRE